MDDHCVVPETFELKLQLFQTNDIHDSLFYIIIIDN